MQSLGPLANGFYQVSYIVADLDEAEQFFKRTFGVRSFGRLRLKARSTEFKCKPDFPGLSGIVALGDMGGMELELIQPTGPGWYADFLRRKGPGLHHLGFRPGFRTEDFDAAVRFLRGLGHEPVAQGAALFDIPQSDGTTAPARTQFAYFDLEFAGASCIEISVPDKVFFGFKETIKGVPAHP
ncbi:MAG TPA: VOC family protein [Candidatus Binataceae bacterium]|jgi:methylmalonyl-CoA/ethylmalonyl-CoA epimerase|nr:VOC family protein [Candidatus Binataceae bacterium]